MADEAKPKRQITPEQLENLKKGREKGLETRRKNRELNSLNDNKQRKKNTRRKSKKKGNEMKQ